MICGRLDPLITDGERKRNSTSVDVWIIRGKRLDPQLVMILYQTIDSTPGSRTSGDMLTPANTIYSIIILLLNRPGS